jgi:hypothetical protein
LIIEAREGISVLTNNFTAIHVSHFQLSACLD